MHAAILPERVLESSTCSELPNEIRPLSSDPTKTQMNRYLDGLMMSCTAQHHAMHEAAALTRRS